MLSKMLLDNINIEWYNKYECHNVSNVQITVQSGLNCGSTSTLANSLWIWTRNISSFHVLQLNNRVTFRLCPFLPNLRGQLDWHVIQRSQKQELLGTYAFSSSTIAASQFSGGINGVNLQSKLRVRE